MESTQTALAQELQSRIRATLPDAHVTIQDPDGAHLSAVIISASFNGLSRIQQHRLVYQALGNAFETDLHALQLTTRTPTTTI
ncbi:MAG: BolA/IbaG family iron-sulfur metabolism protein [Sphingobacteriales bacterium]|nr:MAG: BolA/IbaG family iron-sulfur metabolism protein [Sphingobacteriales bacterium]